MDTCVAFRRRKDRDWRQLVFIPDENIFAARQHPHDRQRQGDLRSFVEEHHVEFNTG
jgi:hypothetical protein